MSYKIKQKNSEQNKLQSLIESARYYISDNLAKTLITAAVLLIVVVIIPSAVFYKKHVDRVAIDYLDRGLALYEQSRLSGEPNGYLDSQVVFQKIINNYALSSSTPIALLYMGNTFYSLDNFAEAKRAFVRFIKKYPNHSLVGLAQRGIAMAAQMGNDYESAVLEYQKLINNYPQFVTDDIRINLADCLEKLRRFDEAKKIYEELEAGNVVAKLRLARLKTREKV